MALLKSNPKLEVGSHFHRWVVHNYGCSALLGFRRMVDEAPDAASVMKLLLSARTHHLMVTREWFVDSFSGRLQWAKEWGDRRFDELCGAAVSRLPIELIQGDIDELRRHDRVLGSFTDRRLAHASMNPVNANPTFQAINDGIDALEQITIRYHLLLTGVRHGPLGGSVDIRDEKIWRFAWIE